MAYTSSQLTQYGRDEIATIVPTTFSNTFACLKSLYADQNITSSFYIRK